MSRPAAIAVHIGADVLDSPRHHTWPRPRSCRDAVERLTRLCRTAGITPQCPLLGTDATVDRVRDAIADSAARTGPGGRFVLSFSGHSERAVPGGRTGGWCLRDGAVSYAETASLLAAAPPSAHLIVVADTCYAASFAPVLARLPATAMLLAACGPNQAVLDHPVSPFVAALERLASPDGAVGPDSATYAWLRRELRRDTPDVERPDVCTNRPDALRWRPFQPPLRGR